MQPPAGLFAERPGFTLIEALVALTLTVLAGAVMLLGVQTTVDQSREDVERTIAAGVARQMMDEIFGLRYGAVGADPYQYPLGPSPWERAGRGRERFNDIDDYHGLLVEGLQDLYGQPLGADDGEGGLRHPRFRVRDGWGQDWRVQVRVYYVDPQDPSRALPAGRTSSVRAVEVVVSRRGPDGSPRELARLRRICSYVPGFSPES